MGFHHSVFSEVFLRPPARGMATASAVGVVSKYLGSLPGQTVTETGAQQSLLFLA